MALDVAAAERAMDAKIAMPLGLDVTTAAEGILRIAVTSMSYAVKAVTTERGLDVGQFAMVVYGGAGPLHASAIAREIGIRHVIVPSSPGHFSAYGMLFGDLRYDYVRSCFHRLAAASFDELEKLYAGMETEGRDAIAQSAVAPKEIVVERAADMRYVGQEHAVTVELPAVHFQRQDRGAIKHQFDTLHAQRYGTSAPGEPAEIVSLRMTVTGMMNKPPRPTVAEGDATPSPGAVRRVKDVYFHGHGFVPTTVYARSALESGNRVAGPALVEEHASTTVVAPGDALVVDAFGNLVIAIGSDRQ
jgi:N-methylhydantoinase A